MVVTPHALYLAAAVAAAVRAVTDIYFRFRAPS
jgi:hypothetical protein